MKLPARFGLRPFRPFRQFCQAICLLGFCAGLCLWLPGPACAQENAGLALRDASLGYIAPLPQGWRELTEAEEVAACMRRVCALFVREGEIRGASGIRAASLGSDEAASPALVLFLLDYTSLGLDKEKVLAIAGDAEATAANLANALQRSYLEIFPRSIMINSHLGTDFFSLNLRSLAEDEAPGAARNQHIKMILTADGALVLMTLYEGPEQAAYDKAIAATVRETIIVPEKTLERVKPPYRATFTDYLMVGLAFLAAIAVLIRARRFMHSR